MKILKDVLSQIAETFVMIAKIIAVTTCGVLVYVGVAALQSDADGFSGGLKRLPLPAFLQAEKEVAYTIKKEGVVTRIFLGDVIHGPTEYNELVEHLEDAESNEIIKVYLNGAGGSVAGMLRLITALDNTKALVIYIVDGDVYSAHALLACKAKKNNITPGITMMFHTYQSSVNLTKGSDALKFHQSSTKSAKDLLTSRCSGILSKDEIEGIVNGVDVYKHF